MNNKPHKKTLAELADGVRRENGKVFIPGLEKYRIGAGQTECTLIAALAGAMQALGEPYTYEDLMGMSGAAFRMQIHQPNWCPSSPHASCGFSCEGVATNVVPYAFTYHWIGKDAAKFAQAREAAVASIDRGIPALISSEETGIVLGYTDGGQTLLGRAPYDPSGGYVPLKRMHVLVNSRIPDSDVYAPWVIWTLKPGKPVPPRKEVLVASLRRALTLAGSERSPSVPGSDEGAYYASGFSAWDTWIRQLRDAKRFETMDSGALSTAMLANGSIYYGLLDARFSAAIYLKNIAGEFDPKAVKHLRAAADLYQRMAEKGLCQRCPTEIAPMPHMLKKGQKWTQEMRNAEADILEKALDLERRAVMEIDKAVQSAK